MAEQIERPSITQGNIASLKATLTRDNEAFPVADAEDVAIALVSGLGRKTVIAPEDYEISMVEEGVIYVDGPATLAPGCYGLEVTGTLNDTPWRTYKPSALVVTYPTVAGGGTATATGDRIDITMDVQMYAMSMRTMEGIQTAIDECEAAADSANDATQTANAAAQGAENVDAELNGTLLTVTNRQGVSQTVDTKGEKGDTGAGVAQGGSTGQVLVKKSSTDYDTEWQDAPASGVSSVNGKSGAVTLGAEDVGALPADTPIPDAQVQSDWNEQDNTKVDYIKNKPTIPTVPTNVSSFNNDAGYITKSVDDLVNYYLKSEVYTKTEVANLIAAIQQFHYEIYASISAVTTPAGNVLYLIGPTGTGADKYEEYVYDSTKQEPWVKIGDTSIDLSGYYTSQQTDSAISQALNTALADYTTTANLTTLLAGKQDALTFETAPSSSNKVATMADMPTTMGASGSGHKGGLVPDTPSTAGTTKFLREDGTWQEPAGGSAAAYTPTLQSVPTSSTTTYIKDGQTVDFEIGQFCRVPNINETYTFYQLYDLVIDGNTTAAVWQEVLVDEDFSLAITVLGANNIPQFDVTETYAIGDFVMYDGKLYKFTTAHPAGVWIGTDAIETNLVKEIDQMSKLDYEQVTINVEDEQGQPIEDVEVVVDVEGETSARNLITDAQGRCTTNVQKGLEYTIEVNTPAGYQHTGQIWHRASLPARMIPITLLEDTTSQYEHLRVTLSYSDSSLGVADHILVSYDGVDYSAPVVNNVAEFDIPLGKTYTVSFPDIEGYIPPRSRTRVAEFGRTYELHIWYHAAIAGIRWLMNNGSEKELNEATLGDYNNIFGLIVNVSELANASTGYILPLDVMVNGGGSGNWLSANEGIDSMENFTSHAAALTDLDGEQNCQKIREHIAYQAAVGITRTSGIAQTVYNRCGGVGVRAFATNVDYAVGDLVSYQNMIYRFTSAHKGNWNAAHVEEYGIGYIMPSGELQRCFQVAYGQIYPYKVVFQQVRDFMATTFGLTPVNVASGTWWTSTQYSATNGVVLANGGFTNLSKTLSSYSLLPALAY